MSLFAQESDELHFLRGNIPGIPRASTCPTGAAGSASARGRKRRSQSPMGQCVRKACPCLFPLCQRGSGRDKPPAGGGGSERRASEPPPPPASGSIYKALWDFVSRQENGLSFQEGDLFTVLSRRDGWWSVRRVDSNGRVLDSGLVPGNYLAPAESIQTQP